jgi:hypothetical protein
VFESLRKSLNDLIDRATPPEERRTVSARMRETLVQAKMGLEDLRVALEQSRRRLAAEEAELATVRRRKALAESISDQETVTVASRFEASHLERLAVLRRKLEAQEAELSMAEREVGEMSTELRAALSGVEPSPGIAAEAAREADAAAGDDAPMRAELDALDRARRRAAREADAERQLDELKRRMGK